LWFNNEDEEVDDELGQSPLNDCYSKIEPDFSEQQLASKTIKTKAIGNQVIVFILEAFNHTS